MSFPIVVFGSILATGPSTYTYTDGDSISTGGFALYMVPAKNIGSAGIDIGFTYINQFGDIKTTVVSTAIASGTTSGTHIKVVLEPGDVGIRNLISINYFVGGTTGDIISLESWNEGLGRTPYSITKSTPDQHWIQSEPVKDITGFTRVFSSFADFNNTIQTDIIQSGYPDGQFSLPIEIIEPNYESDINEFGFMLPATLVTKNNDLKKLRIDIVPNRSYQYIDSNEQSTILKWKWDVSTSRYVNTGFYKLTFDYDVQFNNTYFVFELLDKDGIVVWNRTTTGAAINQVVLFKSLSWEFRLRCKANYTTPAITTDHAQVTNIKIERYKELGTAELNYAVDMPNISNYDSVGINSLTPVPAGTRALVQLAFSDDNSIWSNWTGPDGTLSTYFESLSNYVYNPLPFGLMGYYYKWKVYLTSDGRDTPILYDITLRMNVKIVQKRFVFIRMVPYPYLSPNPRIKPPMSLIRLCPRAIPGYPAPPPGCIGGDYLPEPLSGNIYTQKIYSYVRLCPRTTPGYPALPSECIGGDFLGEPLSGKQLIAKRFSIFKTWLESVVGQVVSGYIQSINEDTIKNAFSLVLMSTISTDITPGGTSIVANVNPDTGLYQTFLKEVIYDKRYVIIKIGIKSIALEGVGVPTTIDGSKKLPSPYNLQFACPVKNCDFTITRKIT